MAIRNVYDEEEKKMLADWKERTDKMIGWLGDPSNRVENILNEWGKTAGKLAGWHGATNVSNRVATADSIARWTIAADCWNPIYRDEDYAKKTRWGGTIAPPFYLYYIVAGGPYYLLTVPPEMGTTKQYAFGDHWTLYKPVRANDTFRVWIGPPDLSDVTDLDGTSPRQFRIRGNMYYINQRDEVVAIYHRYNTYLIISPGTESDKYISGAEWDYLGKDMKFAEEIIYTQEELEAIKRIADNEEIRGAIPRFWEDVNVGDQLKPIVQGPLTIMDNIVVMCTSPLPPMREALKGGHTLVDKKTNIPHFGAEWHLTENAAKWQGQYSTSIFAQLIANFFGRLITNWAGDDGFIREMDHRKFQNVPYSDTILGKGNVTRKYINEKGEYLVDLDVWMESSRGCIADVASVTVSLPSRESMLKKEFPYSFSKQNSSYPIESQGNENPDKSEFKKGNKVRIKDTNNWWLPGKNRLAFAKGTISDVIDEPAGYVTVVLDTDISGIDKRIPLGFRVTDIEIIQ